MKPHTPLERTLALAALVFLLAGLYGAMQCERLSREVQFWKTNCYIEK